MALPADPAPLHADMHAYLAACGVDGVKARCAVLPPVPVLVGCASWQPEGRRVRCWACKQQADASTTAARPTTVAAAAQVDVQSTTGLCGSGAGLGGGPATAAAYHASLEASIGRHFPAQGPQGSATGMPLINCMCHSTGARVLAASRAGQGRAGRRLCGLLGSQASGDSHAATCPQPRFGATSSAPLCHRCRPVHPPANPRRGPLLVPALQRGARVG